MQHLKKSPGFIAIVFMVVISLAVTGFTAYRTIHFIQSTLPQQSWLLAFFALGAFDLGLLGWIALHTWHASSEQQRAISLTMICVDLAGIAVTFLADTVMQSGVNGTTGRLEGGWVITAILITGVIVIGNVVAFIAYHLQSPEHKTRVKQERLRSAVEARADEMVEQQIEVLASQLAPKIAADKMRRMGAQYMNGLGHMPSLPPAASARQVTRPTGKGSDRPAHRPNNVRVMADEYPVEATPPKPRYAKRPAPPPGWETHRVEVQPTTTVYYPAQPQPSAEEVVEHYAQSEEGEGEEEEGFLSEGQGQPTAPASARTITLNTKRGSREVEL